MVQADEAVDRPPGDLTARARIRDAALTQFAERGVAGATMRGIAEAAGVSPGLVQHHFGSKEALRRACDDAVVDALGHRLAAAATAGSLVESGLLAELLATSGPLLRYFARATVDGSPAADTVFDRLAAGTAEFLSTTWPDRFPPDSAAANSAAAVMTAMHAGTVVLHRHIGRHLGVDPLDRAHPHRIGAAMFDVYAAMADFAASPAGERIRASTAEYRTDDRGGEP
ncbi:AcrR family transcriptional regulator [Prauserella sediminis]|uniref:AcrR family transcriptional regulator n=1 Tax=Prauserella sediminis TaxID=577680 RepID=A0A839XNL6_9PSEU|nr:helix-turn-helix domain-containing protein [Prauserella sediminis]MBB3662293.1 AcrR family transcriptional regulator [Prauserella sediminis]